MRHCGLQGRQEGSRAFLHPAARKTKREELYGTNDNQRKNPVRRAEAAVHPERAAASDRPAAGGTAAGSDGGHGRYDDGLPLRRSGHLRRQPGGYDQQPHHRAVCGAGHGRCGGGQPVSGGQRAEARGCQRRSAHPAQRPVRRGGGRRLLCDGPAHDPPVLWLDRSRRTGRRCALPEGHCPELSVPGAVQWRGRPVPEHGQLQDLDADQPVDEHHQHRGQRRLHLRPENGRRGCRVAQRPLPCGGCGSDPAQVLS